MGVKYCTCGSLTEVKDTRANNIGNIKRRRACPKCLKRFTTFEITKYDMDRITETKDKLELVRDILNSKLTKR